MESEILKSKVTSSSNFEMIYIIELREQILKVFHQLQHDFVAVFKLEHDVQKWKY